MAFVVVSFIVIMVDDFFAISSCILAYLEHSFEAAILVARLGFICGFDYIAISRTSCGEKI